LTPAEYHALPPSEQRKAALALGSARLGLAVALAAHAGASSPYGHYQYWLRLWQCPPLPSVLELRGWKWNVAGTALANDRWNLAIHATGDEAIDTALQIVVKHLAPHERTALLEPIREMRQEALL
jgi:hypothetical protein